MHKSKKISYQNIHKIVSKHTQKEMICAISDGKKGTEKTHKQKTKTCKHKNKIQINTQKHQQTQLHTIYNMQWKRYKMPSRHINA